MAKVSLKNVCKIYKGDKGRDVTAVKDFNLEINDREFVVFVGPSGCGKSTTLRMIAGLEEISQGDVDIDGRRVNDVPPKDRDIAMVFQNYALYPHMSVFENMAFGLKLRKFPKAEIKRRVREAAAILGIERLARSQAQGALRRPAAARRRGPRDRPPAEGVPLRRAAFKPRRQDARADARRDHEASPAPPGHDDLRHARSGGSDDDGRSHRRDERRRSSSRSTRRSTLYHEPANLFVAGFLGSPPMNFLNGKLSGSGDGVVFKESGEGTIECKFTDRPACESVRRQGRGARRSPRKHQARRPTRAQPKNNRFQAIVDIVEPMGAETNIYLQTGAHTAICRSEAAIDHSEMGHRHQFEIESARAHLFDPGTAERIR